MMRSWFMLLLVELVWLLSNTQSTWEQRFSPLQGLRTVLDGLRLHLLWSCCEALWQFKGSLLTEIHRGLHLESFFSNMIVGKNILPVAFWVFQEKHAFLRDLGVKYITSSRNGNKFETDMKTFLEQDGAEGVDVVLNSLSHDDYISRSLSFLKNGGRFIEIGKRGIWTHRHGAELESIWWLARCITWLYMSVYDCDCSCVYVVMLCAELCTKCVCHECVSRGRCGKLAKMWCTKRLPPTPWWKRSPGGVGSGWI